MRSASSFEFSAGTPALWLVDTVGRREAGHIERLGGATDLQIWLRLAGFAVDRPPSGSDLKAARSLREAIYRCGMALVSRLELGGADVAILNAAALKPGFRPRLSGEKIVDCADRPVEAALSTLAADAIRIFAPPARDRLRLCPECRMMFLDTSRPGRRRWCSSKSGCGNRAKVRDHRARKAARQSEGKI